MSGIEFSEAKVFCGGERLAVESVTMSGETNGHAWDYRQEFNEKTGYVEARFHTTMSAAEFGRLLVWELSPEMMRVIDARRGAPSRWRDRYFGEVRRIARRGRVS